MEKTTAYISNLGLRMKFTSHMDDFYVGLKKKKFY